MDGETVRAGGATHPRLRILGAIEARLVRADRLVAGRAWRKASGRSGAPIDPFLSRPMREALGLPPPERRIGLAAHDFAQAACAPEVILLHTERRERRAGGEVALAVAAGDPGARAPGWRCPAGPRLLAWARALDAPGALPRPAKRPAPTPPVAAPAAQAAGHPRRDPDPRPLRRLGPRHPAALPAGPARRAGRGARPRHRHPRRLRALRRDRPGDLPADAADDLRRASTCEALATPGMPPRRLAREQALAREAGRLGGRPRARRRADGARDPCRAEGRADASTAGGRPFTAHRQGRPHRGRPRRPRPHPRLQDRPRARRRSRCDTGFSPQLTLTAAILAARRLRRRRRARRPAT